MLPCAAFENQYNFFMLRRHFRFAPNFPVVWRRQPTVTVNAVPAAYPGMLSIPKFW